VLTQTQINDSSYISPLADCLYKVAMECTEHGAAEIPYGKLIRAVNAITILAKAIRWADDPCYDCISNVNGKCRRGEMCSTKTSYDAAIRLIEDGDST